MVQKILMMPIDDESTLKNLEDDDEVTIFLNPSYNGNLPPTVKLLHIIQIPNHTK